MSTGTPKPPGPKIIIRRPQTSPPPSTPLVAPTPTSIAPPTPTISTPDADPEGDEAEDEPEEPEVLEDVEMEVDEVAVKRPRGRPKGRGKATGGTSTPRGTGRGRGRGRGRGKGRVTLRVPGEGGDDDEEGVEEQDDDHRPFRNIRGEKVYIEGDSFITEDDPRGDTKIDKHGNLLGGRVFKAQTFVIPNRDPDRKYMLAIDAARTSGFRDSLYYFRRNPMALKLNATQPEKDYLISIGKLGPHLKTRSVTLITARSAYKLHGSKTIIGGKWVDDDYYEDKVRVEIEARGLKAGDPVGELPDPQLYSNENAAIKEANAASSAFNNAVSGGGTGIYRAGGPTTIFGGSGWGPFSDGPLNPIRKGFLNREGVSEENWMYEAAKRARDADAEWAKVRKGHLKQIGEPVLADAGIVTGGKTAAKPTRPQEEEEEESEGDADRVGKKAKVVEDSTADPFGAYEPHTGTILFRSDTQPTTCRWEYVRDGPLWQRDRHAVLGGTVVGTGAWGIAWIDSIMEPLPPRQAPELPVDLEGESVAT